MEKDAILRGMRARLRLFKPGPTMLGLSAARIKSPVDGDSVSEPQEEDDSDEVASIGDYSELGHREYTVVVDGTTYNIWEYLGEEWNQAIRDLHNISPLPATPEYLCTELREWQLSGVAKLLHLAKGPFKGGILGDEMGLGKTLTVITACEELKQTVPGSFNLIVTTKSCIPQFQEELFWNFIPSCRPKVLELDNPSLTIDDILDENYDYVICTYQFLESRFRAMRKFKDNFSGWQYLTGDEVKRSLTTVQRKGFLTRPTAALFTKMMQLLDLPIRCLVLDECQNAKNVDSGTHKAIKELHYEHQFLLSGTFIMNRWDDAFGAVDLIPGHPFDTKANFRKAFAAKKSDRRSTDPSPSKLRRLITFLQPMVVSRPASLLDLPDLIQEERLFGLQDFEIISLVAWLTRLMMIELRSDPRVLNVLSDDKSHKALYLATTAQLLSFNRNLLRDRELNLLERHRKDADVFWEEFMHDREIGHADSQDDLMRKFRLLASELDRTNLLRAHKERKAKVAALRRSARLAQTSSTSAAAASSNDEGPNDITEAETDLSDKLGDEDVASPDIEQQTSDDEVEINSADDLNLLLFGEGSRERRDWLEKVESLTEAELYSPKVTAVISLVTNIQNTYPQEKIIVFSKFLRVLDLLDRAFREQLPFNSTIRFDGTVQGTIRQQLIEQFQDPDDQSVLLITAGSGGAGLNLTAASHVVLTEPWWRRTDEQQALARAFRQGQTKIVRAWRMVGVDSMIDHSLRAFSLQKTVMNEKIMSKLRRKDDEEPEILQQYTWGAGEI